MTRISIALTLPLSLSLATVSDVSAQAAKELGELNAVEAAASISVADLEHRMAIVAHDSMRGRDTPSPELMATARYVAAQFKALGLEPGAGDGYLQMYPLTIVRPGPAEAHGLRLNGPDGSVDLIYGEQFYARSSGAVFEASGELIEMESLESEIDASGKIAVLHVTRANFRSMFRRGFSEALERANPEAVLLVLDIDPQFLGFLRSRLGGERVTYGEPDPTGLVRFYAVGSELPDGLTEALGEGGSLAGWSVELRTAAEVEVVEAPNTIGYLEGSDPDLKDEYVIFTAHMDHVGVGRAVAGDSIYNGADDNASGTVTIIELAEAFASLAQRPRRSLIFMTVSAEEKGLYGSRWYTSHPTFPLESTVANINMDMIGRNFRDTIVVIGKDHSTLGPTLERVAAEHGELNMAVIDDLWPQEGLYTRSDHYNFARRGVPILFFFSGLHEDYHRPGDEAEKIDYEKTSRIGQLLFYLGLEVANVEQRPQWDPEAYERYVDRAGI